MFNEKLVELIGFDQRLPDEPVGPKHMDLAAAVQKRYEEIIFEVLKSNVDVVINNCIESERMSNFAFNHPYASVIMMHLGADDEGFTYNLMEFECPIKELPEKDQDIYFEKYQNLVKISNTRNKEINAGLIPCISVVFFP